MACSAVAEGSRVQPAAPQEDLHSEEERQAEAVEHTDDDRPSDAGSLPARPEPGRGGPGRPQFVWVPALPLDSRRTWTVLLYLRKEGLGQGRFRRGYQVLLRCARPSLALPAGAIPAPARGKPPHRESSLALVEVTT